MISFCSLTYSRAAQGPEGCTLTVQTGADVNNTTNPFVQPPNVNPTDFNQSLNFSDVLVGTMGNDLLIGGLGNDVLQGNEGNDVLIGGPEHFNQFNRDFILGGPGDDIIIWSPGDGPDFIDGGPGNDTLVIGLIGESVDGQLLFCQTSDQRAGTVFLNQGTNLPLVNVTNSTGFCQIIDQSTSTEAGMQLQQLGVTHLIRFFSRSAATGGGGTGNNNTGLRATLYVKNVENIICASRQGGMIEAMSLTTSPATPVMLETLNECVRAIVR
jgi:Ca2+-binding RTX toxin-like protein